MDDLIEEYDINGDNALTLQELIEGYEKRVRELKVDISNLLFTIRDCKQRIDSLKEHRSAGLTK